MFFFFDKCYSFPKRKGNNRKDRGSKNSFPAFAIVAITTVLVTVAVLFSWVYVILRKKGTKYKSFCSISKILGTAVTSTMGEEGMISSVCVKMNR